MLLLRPLIHYADFHGRSHRGEYVLFMFAQALFLGFLAVLGGRAISADVAAIGVAFPILLGVALLVLAALLIPNLALQARRLHDTNRSARWMCLALPGMVAPIILFASAVELLEQLNAGLESGAAIAAQMDQIKSAGQIWFVGNICNIVFFFMLLMPGTVGPNRFGSDPKDVLFEGVGQSNEFDDARFDAILAQARRDAQAATDTLAPANPHKPVPPCEERASPAAAWATHMQTHGARPARAFGRRAG